jgi:hypothetical protein
MNEAEVSADREQGEQDNKWMRKIVATHIIKA